MLSVAKKVPFTLNKATGRPATTTTLASPGLKSLSRATVTGSMSPGKTGRRPKYFASMQAWVTA